MESQRKQPSHFSFEFFPPRTPESTENLKQTEQTLAALGPAFFSVTYGAGGSTREKTFETVLDIRDSTGVAAVPHISCIGSTREELLQVLDLYKQEGLDRLVALRGDMPSGQASLGSIRYASELVALIREHSGDYFHIDVACYPEFHPQSQSASSDLDNFKTKVDAGANGGITQYFYNPEAYFRFVDSCESLDIDIALVPGIMPITNCTQLVRFSEACGAEIPRWILQRLRDFGDDRESIVEFGIDVTTKLCETLLQAGAPGLHFYTMNQSRACVALWENLGLSDR